MRLARHQTGAGGYRAVPYRTSVLLLALETAADVCGVALHDGQSVVAETSLHVARRHSAALLPLCQALLDASGRSVSDLTAVAVSAGPGSYTGLRIGASTAKGLCTASGAALVPVPTLEALASQAVPHVETGSTIVAALLSRRGEVYAASYRSEERALVSLQRSGSLTLDALPADWLGDAETPSFVGPAARTLAEAFELADAHVLSTDLVRPGATAVARLGAALLARGETADVAAFEPDYLKAFVATRPKPIFSAA